VLYGPPAVGYEAELIALGTTSYAGTFCPYPLYETSVSLGYEDPFGEYDDYEAAAFYAYFTSVDYPDFTGRTVAENVNITSEDCHADLGGPFPPASNAYFMDSSTWTAGSDEYGDDDNADYMSVALAWVEFYQDAMEADGQCTAFWGSQAMSMSHCTIPSVFVQYDTGHTVGFIIHASHPDFGYRGGTSGAVY
jgi:hypothetical protein